MAENGYDLEANLALLKLYQFNPNMLNIEYVCKVLLKSLASLPLSDYLLCKSLLSLEILDNEKVKSIQTMAEMLEACSFKEFWAKSRTDFANLTRAIAGFEDNMRKYVCHVISTTYQRIPEERLCELLGLQDEDMMNQWIGNFKSNLHVYIIHIFDREHPIWILNIGSLLLLLFLGSVGVGQTLLLIGLI